METGLQQTRIILLSTALAITVMLCGCGYAIHKKAGLPFQKIAIGLIENRTLEPKLQDKLHKALVEEFMRQGISVDPSAPHNLTGTIRTFEMVNIAEKSDVSTDFMVRITADFRLSDKEGKIRELNNFSYHVYFTGAGDLGLLLASKEVAEESALANISSAVVGALIYQ
ncbi:MAG: hypothetical protein HZA17_06445 [Nitrospirae bacterium]|nr:hypothetical protein [Nitrospirota bacterium]